MSWAYWLVDLFVLINFLSFTLLSTKLFRLDHAGFTSYLFFLSFLVGTGMSVWCMVRSNNADAFMLALAGVAAALSLLLFVTAAQVIRSKPLTAIFSSDQPSFLHSTGPYRYMRHPFYVAYVLNFLAAYLATATRPSLILFVSAAGIYSLAAKLEEKKFANSDLADEYSAYRKKTRILGFGRRRDKI